MFLFELSDHKKKKATRQNQRSIRLVQAVRRRAPTRISQHAKTNHFASPTNLTCPGERVSKRTNNLMVPCHSKTKRISNQTKKKKVTSKDSYGITICGPCNCAGQTKKNGKGLQIVQSQREEEQLRRKNVEAIRSNFVGKHALRKRVFQSAERRNAYRKHSCCNRNCETDTIAQTISRHLPN
jgi:hypothetical protein